MALLTPGQVELLASQLFEQHKLQHWHFEFDHARNRLGACHYASRKITLSRHLVRLNDEPTIRETLLHEIAHALVGPGHGHGPAWQECAQLIGAKPQACAEGDVRLPTPRWALVCVHCRQVLARRHRRRLDLSRVACGACGTQVGRLTWQPVQNARA